MRSVQNQAGEGGYSEALDAFQLEPLDYETRIKGNIGCSSFSVLRAFGERNILVNHFLVFRFKMYVLFAVFFTFLLSFAHTQNVTQNQTNR